MSSKPNLTNEKIEQLKLKFEDYKNSKLTLDVISKELKMDRSAVGKWFKKLFNNQYSELSKKRCGWKIKLKDEEIRELFESYKNGTSMIELAEEFKIKRDSLAQRMRRLIGLEYSNVSSLRKLESGGRKRQKVSDEKIKEIFKIYKMSKMSLDELSTKIGIRESSLTSRFKKLFRHDYMLIAKSRRNERKLTVLECKEAFDRYKSSNTSLIQLSEELDISCSSLSHRFKKIFGDEYLKISEKKLEMYEVNKKGNLAENLALEFLKLKWKNINDVRKKHILKGTLKRPDFIIGNAFIEVKNYYITISGLGRLKGYKDILRDYLSKEVNDEGKSIILQKGIIISLSGFSPEVINKSKIDDVLIFGPEDLEKTFKENGREDLIRSLKH